MREMIQKFKVPSLYFLVFFIVYFFGFAYTYLNIEMGIFIMEVATSFGILLIVPFAVRILFNSKHTNTIESFIKTYIAYAACVGLLLLCQGLLDVYASRNDTDLTAYLFITSSNILENIWPYVLLYMHIILCCFYATQTRLQYTVTSVVAYIITLISIMKGASYVQLSDSTTSSMLLHYLFRENGIKLSIIGYIFLGCTILFTIIYSLNTILKHEVVDQADETFENEALLHEVREENMTRFNKFRWPRLMHLSFIIGLVYALESTILKEQTIGFQMDGGYLLRIPLIFLLFVVIFLFLWLQHRRKFIKTVAWISLISTLVALCLSIIQVVQLPSEEDRISKLTKANGSSINYTSKTVSITYRKSERGMFKELHNEFKPYHNNEVTSFVETRQTYAHSQIIGLEEKTMKEYVIDQHQFKNKEKKEATAYEKELNSYIYEDLYKEYRLGKVFERQVSTKDKHEDLKVIPKNLSFTEFKKLLIQKDSNEDITIQTKDRYEDIYYGVDSLN